MNIRNIFYICGMFISFLGGIMLIPAFIDLNYHDGDSLSFFISALITLVCGGVLYLSYKTFDIQSFSVKEGFLLTTLTWVMLCLFSALPFILSQKAFTLTDAIFESVSGLTTTGATIMTDIESSSHGLLIWRSMLQWLGGIGIIVMGFTILPFLRIGGMQLFQAESSEREKLVPRTADFAANIIVIYMALTLTCSILYASFGMNTFDAVAHAMTTIATGGFSTKDASFAAFTQIGIQYTGVIFMLLGGLPFILYIGFLRGRWIEGFKDPQIRFFIGLVFGSILIVYIICIFSTSASVLPTLGSVAFNTISMITGTGYANADYGLWGQFSIILFLFIMFIGGCAGSTTCGLKIFRVQVLMATASAQLKRLIHPNAIIQPRYQGKMMENEIIQSVLAFFFIYILSFMSIALILSLLGLDTLTALSGSASAISNVGPGLGDIIGPTGTYASLVDPAKWTLSVAMLLGRLEFFTILVLLSPYFWRI